MLKKVLVVYQSRPPIIDYLSQAFARRGVLTEHFHADKNTHFDRFFIRRINKLAHNFRLLAKERHLFDRHPLNHKNHRSRRLQETLRATDADLVLVIRGWSFHLAALRTDLPMIGWWVEAETRIKEALPEIGAFDWYYFINRSCVETASAQGHRHVGYLPHAVSTDLFRPLPHEAKRYDVAFVGGWSKKRQAYIEQALCVTPNIALYGPGWLQRNLTRPSVLRCIKGRYIGGEALVRLYNQSRVVLNITNWDASRAQTGATPRSGMTMRVLEVPACGAFLLTDRSRELDEFFQPGVHLGVFDDLADFPAQLDYWLHNDPLRREAARAAREQAETLCSYDHLVDALLRKHGDLTPSG